MEPTYLHALPRRQTASRQACSTRPFGPIAYRRIPVIQRGAELIECDGNLLLYEIGHIPGAVKIDWVAELNHPPTRDYIDHEQLQKLLRSKGVSGDTTIVLYGDKNNWWATYKFWVCSGCSASTT